MNKTLILLFWVPIFSAIGFSQNNIEIDAYLNDSERTLRIQQSIQYNNTSNDTLHEIYLNDWANSFASKVTPLANRFAEDYIRKFHYAKEYERGHTSIGSLKNQAGEQLDWIRPQGMPDVIKVDLTSPLLPNESTELQLNYIVKIPDDKFTGYGYQKGSFKLRYWMIVPAVYDGKWNIFSNKNLNDQFFPLSNLSIELEIPIEYNVISDLEKSEEESNIVYKKVRLTGENQVDSKLYILEKSFFETIETDVVDIITDIKEDDDVIPELKALTVDRIVHFLQNRLGEYPHDKMMVTNEEYSNNPIYGLNQLPTFIRPFPDGFQYDMKLLKTITRNYLSNTILLNPREEKWVNDAIHISLMIDYVNTFYPDIKLLGNLSDFIGIKWFHAADLKFNDRYPLFYMNMARLNLDQALTTSQDSLVKFNKNIANPYKAGVGFSYLKDFLGEDESLHKSIKEFYNQYKLKKVYTHDFEEILKKNVDKDIDWFFEDYVATNSRIDFTIDNVDISDDSLQVTIKNKEKNNMPISLYGLRDGEVVSKYWIENIEGTKSIVIPRDDIQRLALNYEGIIPEFNQRNNYKKVTKLLSKPIQFRLLEDVEDPKYNQFFLIPEFDYNLYDGFTIGPKLYNTTILRKNFVYKIAPKFGFKSNAVVGSASVSNTHYYQNQNLSSVKYGFSGTRYSYAYNLFYHKVTPFFSINFRDPYLRDNENQSIGIRSVNVRKDSGAENLTEEPDYSVVDIQYNYNNRNFTDYFTASLDYQVAKKFSKVSVTSKWRQLFLDNRQVELRLFVGAFLFNDNIDSDYFSFALDRPTDYLLDYNYYGRSESTGLFSQQYIEAEGGFKSKLQPQYANQFISTLNGSFTIWNWIHAYGDVGVIKNREENPEFLYDSGVRVSLVQDYFELFFPVYSSLGWETAQDDYDQKIRFIVSLDLNTLIKLFTRRWY